VQVGYNTIPNCCPLKNLVSLFFVKKISAITFSMNMSVQNGVTVLVEYIKVSFGSTRILRTWIKKSNVFYWICVYVC
jgi:hypothetical protein